MWYEHKAPDVLQNDFAHEILDTDVCMDSYTTHVRSDSNRFDNQSVDIDVPDKFDVRVHGSQLNKVQLG